MDILQIAKDTISIEQEAIQHLLESIDQQFVEVTNKVAECEGKIVFTGIGKSALIAQKIVATLNSTGTNAIFMHATDAIHGDMGLINQEDVVIAISKSGETSEISYLVPILNSYGIHTIAMTSNPNSFLATNCDQLLYTPVSKEADPNNLAPTSSTTVQIVMGDALATALLSMKGFKKEHFAKYHPGGSLGKQLYLKVKEIMQDDVPPKVSLNASLQEVLLEMSTKRLGATAVYNQGGQVIGIITDGDIRRYFQKENATMETTAEKMMTKNPKSILANSMAFDAFTFMRKHEISQLIVMDSDNNYAGMIHIHDLIKEGFV